MASNSLKKPKFLHYNKNNYLAYHKSDGSEPGIIFLHGLQSDMSGKKALELEKFAKLKNLSFIRFDFRGHGRSSGNFQDFGISDWTKDILFILQNLTNTPQILVGSSMGGWIMLLAAIKKPKLIGALLGIAAAPDFTVDIFENQLSNDQKNIVNSKGFVEISSEYDNSPYIISKVLLDQGKNNLILNKDIPILCPVHLLHGEKDNIVPLSVGTTLLEKLESLDKKLIIFGNAGHRFSEENEINQIILSLKELVKKK